MDERATAIADFLTRCGWSGAQVTPMPGDASQRAYFRIRRGSESAVLMDAKSQSRAELQAFITIARHLLSLGLSAPRILAQDLEGGFLLLEDFGDLVFDLLMEQDPSRQYSLYSSATDVLIALHSHPAPSLLAVLDPTRMVDIARMVVDWYVPGCGETWSAEAVLPALAEAAQRLVSGPTVLMLRDYRAGNLNWLPTRQGVAQVGLLDFQDAMAAHPAYDLVSALQDARHDVPAPLEAAMITRYCQSTALPEAEFRAAYALLGTQRALRILGIFARLSLHSAKPGYLVHAPRVYGQLQRNLAHPALSHLADLCHRLIPEPTQARLNRIKDLCGTIPTP